MEELFMPSFLLPKDEKPTLPKDIALAMAYVPIQKNIDTYPSAEALDKGTIFPTLDKPFKGRMVHHEK